MRRLFLSRPNFSHSICECLDILISPRTTLLADRLIGRSRLWPRHLNLPTEAILAGRHDCHIVDSGAWRQPGGETAGVCLGLLSSEGDTRLTDLHKTLASADTTATTVEARLDRDAKTSVPVPAANTASARTVVFIDTLSAVPEQQPYN